MKPGTTAKTGFDRFFEQQMKNRKFAAAYRSARAEIDATDKLIRAIDAARVLKGISKADLARKIEAKPEILRRLFTTDEANPTMQTVLKLAVALGYHLELVPDGTGRRSAPRAVAARQVRRK
jgi:ribosome-binding protein aMBF1 (putative translation factor)